MSIKTPPVAAFWYSSATGSTVSTSHHRAENSQKNVNPRRKAAYMKLVRCLPGIENFVKP